MTSKLSFIGYPHVTIRVNYADVFGGVTGRTHSQADINRGYWYLGVSSLLGPLGYFFLLGEY